MVLVVTLISVVTLWCLLRNSIETVPVSSPVALSGVLLQIYQDLSNTTTSKRLYHLLREIDLLGDYILL